jgi:hypothetical protein
MILTVMQHPQNLLDSTKLPNFAEEKTDETCAGLQQSPKKISSWKPYKAELGLHFKLSLHLTRTAIHVNGPFTDMKLICN